MNVGSALARLWRRPDFRRLLSVRVLSQAADGTLLVGMASYVLFSPQNQPNAWAIAGVLALTLLPFTILGPFVSTFLDRWSRRNIAIVSDAIRACVAALIGILIATGATAGAWQVVLFGTLLVAMSLNRFMLAGLSAGLQHTVADDEYLTASSILPTVGPLGVVIGGLLGLGSRAGLGGVLGVDGANALVFFIAAVLFGCSVLVSRTFTPDALGPDPEQHKPVTSAGDVLAGLVAAVRHVATRPPASLALATVFVTRLLFGLLTVLVILAFRNHFRDDPSAALGDLTLWGLVSGVGFILATPVVPVLVRRLGLRGTLVAALVVAGLAQAAPAVAITPPVLFVIAFFVGIGVQAAKICADTLVQAHVAEAYKGRAFILYDMLFNGSFVLAAVVAAVALPADGMSRLGFALMATTYLVTAGLVALAASRIGRAQFERGTEDLTGRAAG